MKPVKQEDGLGCAVACVAFILGITYQKGLLLFEDGGIRVTDKANFYCPEIVKILNSKEKNYKWKRLKSISVDLIYLNYSIVFIKRSLKYTYGHFLVRYNKAWMDPWINLPDKNIKAGFRDRLPGKPTYVIYPI